MLSLSGWDCADFCLCDCLHFTRFTLFFNPVMIYASYQQRFATNWAWLHAILSIQPELAVSGQVCFSSKIYLIYHQTNVLLLHAKIPRGELFNLET